MKRRLNKQIKINEMKEYFSLSKDEQNISLVRNGITKKDLDKEYETGFRDGYKAAGNETIKTIYVGCSKVLADAGNSKDDVYDFLKALDEFVLASISAGDDLHQLLDDYGIELDFIETLERVQRK